MEVVYSAAAVRALRRSHKRALIVAKINALAADPASMPANVKRLTGRPESRLRVQDWRVIFRVVENVMYIDDIGARGAIYQD